MSNLFGKALFGATIFTAAGLSGIGTAEAAAVNFSFFDDGIDDSIVVDGVTITLNTIDVQPFSVSSSRDIPSSTIGGIYTFDFSQPIDSFTASLSRFREDESVTDFSIAPTAVTGDLVLTLSPDPVVTATPTVPRDFGAGDIIFSGINTTSLSLTLDPQAATAIAFDSFSFTKATAPAPTPVPEPISILGSLAALGLGGAMKRKFSA